MFPLQAAYSCQPLPRVNGPTVSEYYGLIAKQSFVTPWTSSALLLSLGVAYLFHPRNLQGLSSSRRFSPRIPRSLWTPADPRSAHQCALFVLASGPLTPSPSAFEALASYAYIGAISSLGECGLPCGLRGALCTLQLFRSVSSPASLGFLASSFFSSPFPGECLN